MKKKILPAIALTVCLSLGAAPIASAASYAPTRYDCSSGKCVKVSTAAPSSTRTSGVNYTPVSASAQEQQLLRMVNQERAKYGLKPLILDAAVSGVARAKCNDMITYKYFAHGSPRLGSVRDMLNAAKISYRGANENIARYGSLSKAFAGLMSSTAHRNSILSKTYTHIGLSVCYDSAGTCYVVQTFISK